MAVEDAWCDYEVRRIPIGQFVLFFTIVDETRTVWVIHAKHGKQLTEPDAFPTGLAALEEDDDDLEAWLAWPFCGIGVGWKKGHHQYCRRSSGPAS